MKSNTTPLLAVALITALGAAACSERKGVDRPALAQKNAALQGGSAPTGAKAPEKTVEPSKVADDVNPHDAAERYSHDVAMIESLRVALGSVDEWKDKVNQAALAEYIDAGQSLLAADPNGIFLKEPKIVTDGIEAARKHRAGALPKNPRGELKSAALGVTTQLMDLVESKEPLSLEEQKQLVKSGKTLLALDFSLGLYQDEGYLGLMNDRTKTREALQAVVTLVESSYK